MARPKSVAADVLLVALAALLLADSFVDWLGQRAQVGPVEIFEAWSAWHFRFTAIAIVLGVLAGVAGILRLCGIDVSGRAILVLGGLSSLLVVFKLITGPHIDTGGFDVTIHQTREIGIYLGLALTVGIAGIGLLDLINEKKASAP